MPVFKQILRRHTLSPIDSGCVLTIGAFDGVHLGHRAILDQIVVQARSRGMESVVLTFEPNPNEFFSRGVPPGRLQSWHEKVESLLAFGIDRLVSLAFNDQLRALTAEQFLQSILLEGLNAKVLVIGDDFHFGCDRLGNFKMLEEFAQGRGYEVYPTPTVSIDGSRVSSTRIRNLLEAGDFLAATRLLGRPYSISGRIVRGEQLGRTLGFPTANIHLKRRRSVMSGVYLVDLEIDGNKHFGVANVGRRPTANVLERPLLEVHLLDFEGNLYGKRVKTTFHHKLREEKTFDSIEALQQAIGEDIKSARLWVDKYQGSEHEHTPNGLQADEKDYSKRLKRER